MKPTQPYRFDRFRGLRLLARDDNGLLPQLLSDALSTGGAEQVRFVNSDRNFWESLLEDPPFDVLIVDWSLTDVEWLHRIREDGRLGDVSIIVLVETGNSELQGLRDAYVIDGVVEKPYTARAILGVIDRELAARANPTEFQRLLRRGRHLLQSGNPDQARRVFETLQTRQPESLNLKRQIGEAQLAAGDLAAAEATFQAVAEEVPRFARAREALANIHEANYEDRKAARELKRLMSLCPRSAKHRVQLGNALRRTGDDAEAEAHLARAIGRHRHGKDAAASLIDLLLGQNRPEEALAAARRLVTDPDDQAQVFNELGLHFREQNKLDLAGSWYDLALQPHPKHPVLLYNAAVVKVLVAQRSTAERMLRKALKEMPDFEPAQRLYAVLKTGAVPEDGDTTAFQSILDSIEGEASGSGL